MEYAQLDKHLPEDVLKLISKYEPDTRTYAIKNKPLDITYWNKNATNMEIMYGNTVKTVVKNITTHKK